MRLPSKIEVNNQVATQRKRDIDEGLALARKVDALRQTLASLEQQHNTFIAGMEGELHKRTDFLISEVANLERDVADLEERKKQLQIPLDEEWAKVNARVKEIENSALKLKGLEDKLNQRELVQDERDRKSKEVLVRVKVRDRASRQAYEQAENTKNEADKIKAEISAKREIKEVEYAEKDKEYAIKEQSLVSYKFTLEKREEQVEMKEQEVKDKEIQLKDREETLERELKRCQTQK